MGRNIAKIYRECVNVSDGRINFASFFMETAYMQRETHIA